MQWSDEDIPLTLLASVVVAFLVKASEIKLKKKNEQEEKKIKLVFAMPASIVDCCS